MNTRRIPPKPQTDTTGIPGLMTMIGSALDWIRVFWPLLLLAFVLGCMVFFTISMFMAEAACLAHGYDEFSWSVKSYCSRLEDGNTVVVPLSDLAR